MLGNQLHHAYLIEGDTDSTNRELLQVLENDFDLVPTTNPDFHFFNSASLTIDETRLIKERQLNRSVSGGKKIFIISFNTATHEAQNSLLKVLEEPTFDTHLFIITPHAGLLLPTVRSRLIYVRHRLEGQDSSLAKTFIKSTKAERLELISKLIKDIKDEKVDRAEAVELIQGIEKQVYEMYRKDRRLEYADALREIEKCHNYANDRSASLKLLLEHIALMI